MAVNLNQSKTEVYKALECPVCTEYMRAPIFLCTAGHSVCSTCKKKLKSCSCCRKSFSEARNFSLEHISENLKFPCKNADFGCLNMKFLVDKKDHEKICFYRPYECLPGKPFGCRWIGKRQDILEHVKKEHSQYAWMLEDNTNLGNAKFSEDKNVVQIISAHGEIFWYKLRIKSEEKTRYVSVHYIGPEENCSEYFYEMSYISEFKPGYKVVFSAPTHPEYVEIDDLIRSKSCSTIHYEMAKHFLVKDNLLKFTLKIHKK